MHQAVEVPCRFLDLLSHVIVDLHIEYIGDEIQGVLIVLDFRIEARQVEAVG